MQTTTPRIDKSITHNTRNSNQRKSYQRTKYVKHSLFNKEVDIWSNLDPNLKNTVSYNILKKNSKIYFTNICQAITNYKSNYI